MEFSQIQDLIKLVSRTKITEFELKEGDFKLVIRSHEPATELVKETQVVIPSNPQSLVQMQQQAFQQHSIPAPPTPTPAAIAVAAESAAEAKKEDANYVTIKSPMVGTFYRAPGPDKAPYVKVGDSVAIGDTVCVIEAMKLFNEIDADSVGKIVKVLVEDAQPVEYDQPLFLVDPS